MPEIVLLAPACKDFSGITRMQNLMRGRQKKCALFLCKPVSQAVFRAVSKILPDGARVDLLRPDRPGTESAKMQQVSY